MSKEDKKAEAGNCLDFLIKDGIWSKKFIDIISDKNFNHKKHYVPTVWPDLLDQTGPNCGIYSAYTGFKYSGLADPGSLPHPRKLDMLASGDFRNKHLSSLRKTAKKEGITNFGPIYKIQHFSTLAKSINFTGVEELRLPETEKEYIDQMCHALESNQTIIAPADVNDNGHPGNESGNKTHWALIFGYIYIGETCYFLTTQYGEYYLWNATDLFNSNKNLPVENPTQGTYIKINKAEYQKVESKSDLSKKTQYTIDDQDLNDFRFTAFTIPALPMKKTVADFHALARERLESFSPPSQPLNDFTFSELGATEQASNLMPEYFSSFSTDSTSSAPPPYYLSPDSFSIASTPSPDYLSADDFNFVPTPPPYYSNSDHSSVASAPPPDYLDSDHSSVASELPPDYLNSDYSSVPSAPPPDYLDSDDVSIPSAPCADVQTPPTLYRQFDKVSFFGSSQQNHRKSIIPQSESMIQSKL